MSNIEVTRPKIAEIDVASATDRSNPAILTIAHRACWDNAPENSIAAVEAAIAHGVEIVEIDVQTTSDGALVVIHDETLNRTTNGSGRVGETALATIRSLRLRDRAGGTEAVTSERLPLLNDMLEATRGRILVNLDVKEDTDIEAVADVVRELGMEDQIILKTRIDAETDLDRLVSAAFFQRIPHMPMMKARSGYFAADLERIARLSPPMIETTFQDLAEIAAARPLLDRMNARVWVNTIDVSHPVGFSDTLALRDPDAVWGRLIEAGVGAVQTDQAIAFKAWLARR